MMTLNDSPAYILKLKPGQRHVSEDDYKTFFKLPPSIVGTSRNKYFPCGLVECSKVEMEGQVRFPYCSECKHVRYCVRIHN